MNDTMEASDAYQSGPAAVGSWAAEGGGNGAQRPYSGAVAQRVLFGSGKRRTGCRRVVGKDGKSAPSRLSKVSSGGDNAGS